MIITEIEITGITPLQQSKEYTSRVKKTTRETHGDYEDRTWMERAHVNSDGNIYVPGQAFKMSMVEACRYTGEQIKGQGKKTYTQKFQSGLCVVSDLDTGIKKDKVQKRSVFGSSNGKPGGGRVWKHFPTLPKWGGVLEVHIYDEIISKEILEMMLDSAGKFIGVGTWRPSNGGEYGRFTAKIKSWKET